MESISKIVDHLKLVGMNTIVRILVLIVLLINQILVVCGVQSEAWEYNDVYASISTFCTAAWSLWVAWKDNDLRKKTIKAKEGIKDE